MANEKNFAKAIADIIGAGIVGVTVTAMVKGGKSSSDKERSDSQPQKASEDIFEEERVKQEMDEMWGKIE